MSKEEDYILLKWGTLKGWKVSSKESVALLERYDNLGASLSCMAQKDTEEQKNILCELIQQHEGSIMNDWSGEEYTKEQAIDYIRNYGKK